MPTRDASGTSRVPMSLIVLTYNEEANLPACLASADGLVDETIVVDSGSTDATVAIAESAGATVAVHAFTTHAEQWEWALANVAVRNDWVLGLDADQRLTPELRRELFDLFLEHPERLERVDGFYLNRRQIFRGKWIRHGGYYPKYLLKLFRFSAVRLESSERLDHHFYVNRTARLTSDLIESNAKEDSIGFWLHKHVRYAELLAEEACAPSDQKRTGVRAWRDPADRAIALKAVWRILPRYWRGFGFFAYRYFVRLGFLDGREGFLFHFLQSWWFRVVVDVMIEERAPKDIARRDNHPQAFGGIDAN